MESICETLLDTNQDIRERFKALFTLKLLGGDTSLKGLLNCLDDDSVLLKHEAAYCLGQMRMQKAVPKLISVVKNTSEDVIVRHEAAEALGAIGDQNAREVLEMFKDDPQRILAESCQIALGRLKWLAEGNIDEENVYHSVDPAPRFPNCTDIGQLYDLYIKPENSLFERYRAMFTLRDIKTTSSLMMLIEGLEDQSPLFRHEVAFVLGQRRCPSALPFLDAILRDESEHPMVRHECAESIGSIAVPECPPMLTRFLNHENRLIRESCQVGLHLYNFISGDENEKDSVTESVAVH